MRNWLPPQLMVFSLLVPLAPGVAWSQSTPVAQSSPAATTSGKSSVYEQLNLFGEAFERIRQDAVEPVTDQKLIETAIAGMMGSLDPNCVYLTEDEYKAQQQNSGDQPTGSTGLVVTIDSGALKVVSPRDRSPAADAGIKPGETIVAIDKQPVFDSTLPQIEAQLRGPVDSEVTLTFRGDDSKPHDVKLKRVAPNWSTVASHLEGDDVGYIRIAGFDGGTQAALTAAVQNLQRGGNKLTGYVIDLRNNPGGNFDVAVQAADDFIDKGDITVVKGRKGEADKHIAATPGDLTNGAPIVALVNGGTASEAELVAGALEDNHRAVLVGTKTFGESAIQTLIPLNGNGAIKLTTARFETPSARPIQGKGLEPDVTVAPVKLERIAQGFGRREADLPGALKNTDPVTGLAPPAAPPQPPGTNPANPAAKPGATGTGSSPSATTAEPTEKHDTRSSVATGELGGAEDEQLTQALDMLRGLKMAATRNGQ